MSGLTTRHQRIYHILWLSIVRLLIKAEMKVLKNVGISFGILTRANMDHSIVYMGKEYSSTSPALNFKNV